LYKTLTSGDWTRQATQFAVNRLIPAINQKIDSKSGSLNEKSQTLEQCDGWFNKIPPDVEKELNTEELIQARECLRLEVKTLEDEYSLFAYTEENHKRSNKKVAERRKKLLDHMNFLAHNIDPKSQLDLSAQQLSKDKLGDRRIMLSDRVFPITGKYLASFGAFIDKSFREFDYYAGIYDAINNIATYSCETQFLTENKDINSIIKDTNKCVANMAKNVYEALGIGNDNSAKTVFALIAKKEHPEENWKWADNTEIGSIENNLLAVGKSLDDTDSQPNHCGKDESEFKCFIRKLESSKFDRSKTSHTSPELVHILENVQKDEINWYYPITSRASERLLALEKTESECKKGGSTATTLVKIGALGVKEVAPVSRTGWRRK
jgi:hypothetical protein